MPTKEELLLSSFFFHVGRVRIMPVIACPICGASPVVDELCPADCGSLEGLLVTDSHNPNNNPYLHATDLHQRPQNRLFGFEWSKGYVAPFLGVNIDAAKDALRAAGVDEHQTKERTTMVDLGCGDGRICHAAAALGAARAVGYDLDDSLIAKARAQKDSATAFHVGNLFDVDVTPFTLITVFLLPPTLADPRLVRAFRTVLEKPGGRVISFGWNIPALEQQQDNDGDGVDLVVQRHCYSNSGKNDDDAQKQPRKNERYTDEDYSGLVKHWYLYYCDNDR